MSRFFAFPDPVNETSARLVAGGVVSMTAGVLLLDQSWLLFPLSYGFAARVTTGPRLSPLGQLATRVLTPRIPVEHRYAPGPPKRLAQGVGFALSASALLLHRGLGRRRAARALETVLLGAAALEAFFGVCLACRTFPLLMRAGLVPDRVCERCADLRSGTVGSGAAQALPDEYRSEVAPRVQPATAAT